MEKFMSSSSSSSSLSSCKNQLHVDLTSKLQFCHLPDNNFFWDRYFFSQVFVLLLIFLFVSFNSRNIAVSDDDASPKIVP